MSRVREAIAIDEPYPTPTTPTYDFYVGGCNQLTGPTTYTHGFFAGNSFPRRWSKKTMTDEVIPDFKKRQGRGEVFFNPLEIVTESWEWTPFWRSAVTYNRYDVGCTPVREYLRNRYVYSPRYENTLDLVKTEFGDPMPAFGSYTDNERLKNLAIAKAWANVSQEDLLALVTMAEMDKTVDGLTDLTRKALKLIRNTRKKGIRALIRRATSSPKRKAQLAREVSDLYLQARYGLRPLYYEIMGLISIAEKQMGGKPKHDRITARGYKFEKGTKSEEESVELTFSSFDGTTQTFRHEYTDRWDVEARAGALCKVQLDMNAFTGIGLIGQTAFELIPYSFIIGWFLNVANFVAMWSPNPQAHVLGTWVTVTETLTRNGTVSWESQDSSLGNHRGEISGYCTPGKYQILRKRITRIPNPSKPILPSWEVNLDPLKLLDLGLIAKNLFKESSEHDALSRGHRFLRF